MSENAYLELSRLTKSYPSPKGEAVIVKDVDFKFRKGDIQPIKGASTHQADNAIIHFRFSI